MNFLTPWYWLLLAPLAGAIIFLYLLKLKRLPRVVSSVLLWNRLIADLQANAPFQRLRRNLLLYLQLLALLVVVAALARPFFRAKGLEGQSIVLVLDASGSMKASDVPGTRFGQAQRIALKAVDDLGRGDTLMLIAASSKTRVVSAFTSDKRALAAAINGLECTDTTTHLEDALRLADSLCARKKRAQIVVLSDGAFRPIPSPIESQARVTFTRLGRRANNVAITALGARRSFSGSGDYEVFVATENFSPSPRTFTVEVSCEGRLLDAREQTLSAGRKGAEVFKIPAATTGLVTAKLDLSDDLPADNSASCFLVAPRRASVLLITRGDLFLERALVLDPSLEVVKAASPPAASRSYDLVVVEGLPAARLPSARGYLFINTSGETVPVAVGNVVAAPTIVDWARSDPVTRYVDLSAVRIAQARAATPRPWARALADSEAGALIAAGERRGVRSVYVGWDLLQSDFPLRVAFPIFIANCVDWLIRPATGGEERAVLPGEVVSLTVPAGLAKLRLSGPSGRPTEIAVDRNPLLIEDTETAGVYRLDAKNFHRRFVVNALSREESNLQPVSQISLAGRQVAGSQGPVRTNKELWRWLLIAALLLVTLEWAAYHRRP
jgi:hypothetical protein